MGLIKVTCSTFEIGMKKVVQFFRSERKRFPVESVRQQKVLCASYATCGKTHLIGALAQSKAVEYGFGDTIGKHTDFFIEGDCSFLLEKYPSPEELHFLLETELASVASSSQKAIFLLALRNRDEVRLTRKFYEEKIEKYKDFLKIIIVVTCCDETVENASPYEESVAFASEIGASYVRTSALKYVGIDILKDLVIRLSNTEMEKNTVPVKSARNV